MPKKDGNGPPQNAQGPKDGRGKGKGNYSRNRIGTGAKTGGGKGRCK